MNFGVSALATSDNLLITNRVRIRVTSFNLHSPALLQPIPKQLSGGYCYLTKQLQNKLG